MAAGGGGGCDPLAPAGVPCAFSPDATVTCGCGRRPTTGCTRSTCLPRTSAVPAPAWPGRQRGCRPR
ncbi:hypothetical protein A6R68_11738 [Neotoma lepida]|uniref:Uncharacterized protein n=1 Tax=Neotoma lepida TaxID=56216 RepID=A0A1A6FU84_NEOLE|nr:hypothetical protein A6R68_11738 [Neotoma lepida]